MTDTSALPQTPALWLIPSLKLKSKALQQWRGGLLPQILTLGEWALQLGAIQKTPDDLHFDPGIDRLTAASLLHRAGMDGQPVFIQHLLAATYELADLAAAIKPSSRLAWAAELSAREKKSEFLSESHLVSNAGFNTDPYFLEAALNQLALAWAASSSYQTDILWQRHSDWMESTPHIYISEGLRDNHLIRALLLGCEAKTSTLNLVDDQLSGESVDESADLKNPLLTEYVASDLETLVHQSVACVLSQLKASSGQVQIALVDLDRKLTRRICALLRNRGVAIQDEAGWAMSTTTVAAQVMAWLEALAPNPTSDAVLAAMKIVPTFFDSRAIANLEIRIRGAAWFEWRHVHFHLRLQADFLDSLIAFEKIQTQFSKPRPMRKWLQSLAQLLQQLGLWASLESDEAGQQLLSALHLQRGDAPLMASHMTLGYANNPTNTLECSDTPVNFSELRAWVRAVLEEQRFRPDSTGTEGIQVTVLPLLAVWGRTFDSVVVPGCDEAHLTPTPAVSPYFSQAQRLAWGLTTPEEAARIQAEAWQWLCSQSVHFLWAKAQGEQAIQPSPLLDSLRIAGKLQHSQWVAPQVVEPTKEEHSRDLVNVFEQGVVVDWSTHAPTQVTASAYGDLRACPYRFYATHLLGLKPLAELDEEVDARDIGNWVHGLLFRFHEAEKNTNGALAKYPERSRLMDECAAAERQAQHLDAAVFLPIDLMWPTMRDAYLAWLGQHEADGNRYQMGEVEKSRAIEIEGRALNLYGKIDRIDQANGVTCLMDYKTESLDKIKKRIKSGFEDTQLAFYAALVIDQPFERSPVPPIQVAYVHWPGLSKTKKEVSLFNPLTEVETRAQVLFAGIQSDLERIAQGQGLRALGEDQACEFCKVRGLCRKDFQ
jgi:ATP-dependent helicase/nuclease subunit B